LIRHRSRGFSILVCLSLVILGAPEAAEASSACLGTGEASYFDGLKYVPPDTTSLGVHKAKAVIADRIGEPCSDALGGDSVGGTSVWVMVAGLPPWEYAQIGYTMRPGWTSPRGFYQWNSGECNPALVANCYNGYYFADLVYSGTQNWWASGSTHTYEVKLEVDPTITSYTAYRIGMSVGGSEKAFTPWDPHAQWTSNTDGAELWSGQFFGETHDLGDDIAGSSGQKTTFRSMAVATCNSCSYVSADPVSASSDQPGIYQIERGGVEIGTCFACMNIWTERAVDLFHH
jgi:hypothetical protein